jgi:hypothetical protein
VISRLHLPPTVMAACQGRVACAGCAGGDGLGRL